MAKLKIQMQITLDGIVGTGNNGGKFNWDPEIQRFSIENLQDVGTVLLGRKTAENFIPFWGQIAGDPAASDHRFAKTVMGIPRVVFSGTVKEGKWENTTVLKGELDKEIEALKRNSRHDIIVYGGASFAGSLISHRLVDEFCLLLNPLAAGAGETIFAGLRQALNLQLRECRPFHCGTVLLQYSPGA